MRQQYNSYKPSGIDWIGDIPSHWTVCRIKDCFILKTGTTPKGFDKPINDNEINWFTPSDINSSGTILHEAERKLSENLINKEGISLFPQKSLIFVGIGATAGKLGYAEVAGYSNQQITGLIPKSCCSKYYFYYLCHDSQRVRDNASFTTLPIINNSYLSQVYWVMPPLAEQEAIAAWLDEKCGEIDAAIDKVNREIELIDELKQSEISRIVTRGLNPDAPLRPSGIDWIGVIPEHWTRSRIKNHISRSAAGVWGDDEKGNMNDIICFRIADFNYEERCLSFDKITIRNIDPKQLEGRYLSKGDLLIEKSGGGEATPVGRVVYCNYDGKATYTNFIHSISLSDNVDSRFFLYYFSMLYSNKINLLYFNQTTGLQNLQIGEYLGQPIYLPPLSEQQEIADYLDKKCAEIDGLKAKLTKKRETLTELRQSIISEVVTGKRKVI